MKTLNNFYAVPKHIIGLIALAFFITACSGGAASSSSSSGGAVTGVATPSKVSVVNTN